jgi:hypothetical protein
MTPAVYVRRVLREPDMSALTELWLQVSTLLWVVPVAVGLVAAGLAMDRADRGTDRTAD